MEEGYIWRTFMIENAPKEVTDGLDLGFVYQIVAIEDGKISFNMLGWPTCTPYEVGREWDPEVPEKIPVVFREGHPPEGGDYV